MEQQPETTQSAPIETQVLLPEATARNCNIASLEAHVSQFIDALMKTYPARIHHRPQAFKKRVLKLIEQGLPPFPKPTGRPPSQRITRAVELLTAQEGQVAEGKRKRIDWPAIARECIPGFDNNRSQYRRRVELDRLQNSVSARRSRMRTHKREPASSDPKTAPVC